MASFKILFLVAIYGLVLLASIEAASSNGPTGKRVLAILDDLALKQSHSKFFEQLEGNGYTVDFLPADKNAAGKIHKYGEWFYDHIVLFAPHAEEFAGLDAEKVLEFVDQGGNLIVAADSDLSDAVKSIATDCNVEFDNAGSFVLDHQEYDTSDDGSHTLVAANNYISDKVVVGSKLAAPVLFQGVGMDLQEDSPLLFSVLSGSSFSYSHNPHSPVKTLHVVGKKTSLVAALQARNNARVLFSGSLELFSNKFFDSKVEVASSKKKFEKSGNAEFAKSVAEWTFQERGALRASDLTHHIVGESVAPATYTVNDTVHYSIKIEEWNGKEWVPFKSSDVQMEFIMLDPYVRLPLSHDDKGTFSVDFVAPDVYGVFTFQVQFHKKGYGFINLATQVPVRPYRHTQFERFIPSAFPYYASAFSMIFGLFAFSWVFLYTAENRPRTA